MIDYISIGSYRIKGDDWQSNGLTSIGSDAFGNCTAITSMNLPNSMTSVVKFAFDKYSTTGEWREFENICP